MVSVYIDRINCISCASCWETCPDIFEQNPEDTFSEIVEEYRAEESIADGEVPGDLEECARAAEELCPVQIIHVG
jgi:ferredoxin